MKKLINAILILSSLLSIPADAQNAVANRKNDVGSRIARIENGLLLPVTVNGEIKRMSLAERMEYYGNPGVSIAVINNNKVEWVRSYGTVEKGSSKPVTPQTLFQAASISKPVTVIGAMRMVEAGLLSLDDDVNNKLSGWKVPENEFTKDQKVTLRRLASHSAGTTVHGFPGYKMGSTIPSITDILDGKSPANTRPVRVDLVPGSTLRYSGGGTTILQLLMQDVSKKAFPQLMNDLVLKRVGMKNSTFEQSLPQGLRQFAATGHEWNGNPIDGKWNVYPEMAAAGLWTTPGDLALLAIEINKANRGLSKKLLSRSSVKEILTYQKDEAGLGFALTGQPSPFKFSHTGSNKGFNCLLAGYIDRGQGVVIMTNSEGGILLMNEILRAVGDEYGWEDVRPEERTAIKVDKTRLPSYTGVFQRENNGPRFTVTFEDEKLYIQQAGRSKFELFAEKEDTFYYLMPGDLRFIFKVNKDGEVTQMAIREGNVERQAHRVAN